jgi:hypothetical protein
LLSPCNVNLSRYPKDVDKLSLAKQTGLTRSQVYTVVHDSYCIMMYGNRPLGAPEIISLRVENNSGNDAWCPLIMLREGVNCGEFTISIEHYMHTVHNSSKEH